ncbi:DNA polymerase III subunit beta [Mesorhizobium sp. L-8-10]|uniref:DNA polymerase III subunit beta n=1 Tax=Mesorhizobium sp. L-8-10 TaxID=2744523 RepID=UPI001926F911|nr:DNA polymerase III subunit beta [Mesorhizobium sp. L-8-10]BCH33250.1 DNA polymerase III subunit beta [Mesorhizobium sp. L-8-10]
MKFTIKAKPFADAVTAVGNVSERRNTIPILSNMVVEAATGMVTLRATDLDLELTLTAPADVTDPGVTTVPARLLSDIARKFPGGSDIAFTMSDSQSVTVSSGRSRFGLHTLPVEDYPSFAAGDFANEFHLTGEALFSLFEQVQFAISTEETRYYLNGIYLHTMDDGGRSVLRAVATDGHRLARGQVEAPSGSAGMKGIIIPRKTVGEILKLAKAAGQGEVAVETSDTKIRLSFGGTVIASKLIDGTFPDYERVIPKANNRFAKVDSKTLSLAADRVATISSERGKAVKMSIEPGQMKLVVNNPDSGDAEEMIDIDYDADPLEIGFNANYLKDVLAVMGPGETTVNLEDAGSPALFTNEKAKDLLIVLMPMRV